VRVVHCDTRTPENLAATLKSDLRLISGARRLAAIVESKTRKVTSMWRDSVCVASRARSLGLLLCAQEVL